MKTGIPQENGVLELMALLKADGVWNDPPEGWAAAIAPILFNDRIKSSIPLAVG